MTSPKSLLLGSALLFAFALSIRADSITKTDGTVISGVSIVSEGISEITYKEGRSTKTVSTASVRDVSFDAYPEDVDEAMGLIAEGDALGALDYLDSYVDDQVEKPNERRYKWAPAFAAHLSLKMRQRVFDLAGMESAAKRLIMNYGSSRYVPEAFLLQARAEAWSGDGAAAEKTLASLEALAEAKNLSDHWKREIRLAKVELDPEKVGPAKRAALADISRDASGKDPLVWARARVAEGESYLVEAEGVSASKAAALREKARRVFEDVISKDGADEAALAGAYAGLGDCTFFAGAAADDAEILKQAVTHYLRVVVSYPGEGQYVPKALFFAMRCFDLMGDRSRTRDMRRALLSLYSGTSWAERPEVRN